MPLFEYKCENCALEFEKIVYGSTTKVTCRGCGSPNIEKKLSVFAVSEGTTESLAAGCGTCGAPEPGMCGMGN